jgi:hypothetical protein
MINQKELDIIRKAVEKYSAVLYFKITVKGKTATIGVANVEGQEELKKKDINLTLMSFFV